MSRQSRFESFRVGIGFAGVLVMTVVVAACSQSPPSTTPAVPVNAAGEPEFTGPAIFEDVTARCGIDFTYRNGEDAGNFAIIESLGGGVALLGL